MSAEDWQQARNDLLTAEKEATRGPDSLAVRRCRPPIGKFGTDVYDTPAGLKTLADLFDDRTSWPSTGS